MWVAPVTRVRSKVESGRCSESGTSLPRAANQQPQGLYLAVSPLPLPGEG